MKLLKVTSMLVKGFPLAGKTFYDPKRKRFFHIKAVYLGSVESGGFTGYYEDSHSNIHCQMLSWQFLSNCQLVGSIDKFPFAELDQGIDAWKVKGYSVLERG